MSGNEVKLRIFKNAWFERFTKRENIDNKTLLDAIADMEKGLVDANLGGGVIKQRIARKGKGKSGGYRTIIAFKKGDKAFFIYGFAKNERDNISRKDLKIYKKSATRLLKMTDKEIHKLIEDKELKEIKS